MTAHIRWNPRKQIITLQIAGDYTLDEAQQVNQLIGEICTAPDFTHAYLIVEMNDVQRPSYSAAEGIQNTSNFRTHDLRLMVVCGLPGHFQFIGKMFRPVIENAVGMPLHFASTLQEAKQVIQNNQTTQQEAHT